MKRIIVMLLLPVFLASFPARGQVFIGTEPTGNSVLLEVVSNDKGVLIPRINIPDTLAAFPVINPKTGLFVMNTCPGKEGLYFWNGQAWEKMKTSESAVNDLLQTGKRGLFIGQRTSEMTLSANSSTDITLDAKLGALTADGKGYEVQEAGVYEVTASFTGKPGGAKGVIALYIYNMTKSANLAYTTVNQEAGYTDIAAKAIYYGLLERNDKIGLRVYYGTATQNKVEKLNTAILSIKKISTN